MHGQLNVTKQNLAPAYSQTPIVVAVAHTDWADSIHIL